jgi:hypothetical protein
MSRFAQDAEPLQAAAQFLAALAVLIRQRQPQLAVREADLKAIDHLRMCQAAAFEIAQRFRRLLQRPVIKPGHIAQRLPVIGIRCDWRLQFHRRSFAHHTAIAGG